MIELDVIKQFIDKTTEILSIEDINKINNKNLLNTILMVTDKTRPTLLLEEDKELIEEKMNELFPSYKNIFTELANEASSFLNKNNISIKFDNFKFDIQRVLCTSRNDSIFRMKLVAHINTAFITNAIPIFNDITNKDEYRFMIFDINNSNIFKFVSYKGLQTEAFAQYIRKEILTKILNKNKDQNLYDADYNPYDWI